MPRSAELRAFALADGVTFVLRHWNTRTERFDYCPGDSEACVLCQAHIGKVSSGYLPVLTRGTDGFEAMTLVVPEGAFRFSTALQAGQLRGKELVFWRLTPGKNGPVRCRATGTTRDPDTLPSPWDIDAELLVRYGFADRHQLDADEGREALYG